MGAQVAAALNLEKREKGKREKYIIIFGLEVANRPEADVDSIHQLVSILKSDKADFDHVKRLKSTKKPDKKHPYPVLVVFKSSAQRK